MNIFLWLSKAWDFLVDAYLAKKFPQYIKIFENTDTVLEMAGECVSAAQATGADGVAKKAQAAQALLDKLKARGIDLPGDADLEICKVIVEAMIGGIKRFLRLP